MIWVVQRVVPVRSNSSFINVYRYTQSPKLDNVNPLTRFHEPGTLFWVREGASPPGNRIISFIDVSLPSDVSWEELEDSIRELLGEPEQPLSPYQPEDSRIAFAYGIDSHFVGRWQQELATLLNAALGHD